MSDIISSLNTIFDEHKDKRICVIGTTCSGKTTLTDNLEGSYDLDQLLVNTLSDEEKDFIFQNPLTEEASQFAFKLARERIKIEPGHPIFSIVLLDCDVLVYLDITDDALLRHCTTRGETFEHAKKVKNAIEFTMNHYDNKDIIIYTLLLDE